MKTFLYKTFLFLAATAIAYAVLICIIGDYGPSFLKKNINYRQGTYGHMFTRIREVPEYKNCDILVIGSSHAYRGIDPRIFADEGLRVFNLGSSGQTPVETYFLLSRYLRELNPKAVIIEVYPETFEMDGVESSLDIIANDRLGIDNIQLALKLKNIKTFNTLIYAAYRRLFNRDRLKEESAVRGMDRYISGGYVERVVTNYNDTLTFRNRRWSFKGYQKKEFERAVKLLKSKGIDFALVQMPVTKSLYSSYVNNQYADEYFSSTGRYINMNNVVNLSDGYDFYDADHMNQSGVQTADSALIDTLMKAGFIKGNKY